MIDIHKPDTHVVYLEDSSQMIPLYVDRKQWNRQNYPQLTDDENALVVQVTQNLGQFHDHLVNGSINHFKIRCVKTSISH